LPEIVFDGKKLTVPAGTNLIEAGLEAGVPVPVFCYHKDLGAVGSCRVCAVTVTREGKSRTVMGCMTEAQDGMDVTTLDRASVELRKYVIEWLMENHPHDCPICDEGGECQLQDLTIACGHGQRRFEGKKRTFRNQYLGEFIQHEMNRCITCYRCSRFYQEYAGGRDFGATGSRNRVYFGRFTEGPLESPFSGNLVELCPTGVFTDKLFRYKSRVWDLEISPSICPHCSVGCNVLPGSRHRELQRVRVRENPAVNGVFLCDRGQFGHGYVMHGDRPLTVRAHGADSNWEQALGVAGGALLAIAREHGAESVALVTSPRASVETHASLAALADGPLKGARVAHFDDPDREPRAIAALAALIQAGCDPLEQSDVAHADVLLVAGGSLVDEAPLAALAARQVARRGGRLLVLNAGERYLGDVAEVVLPTHPADLAARLAEITGGIANRNGDPADPIGRMSGALGAAARPALLFGGDLLDGPAFAAAVALARALTRDGKKPRLGFVFPGPNGFGAAAIARAPALADMLAALESGKIRAAVLAECDVSSWSARARAALEKLDLLVALDHLPDPQARRATIFLPTTATYESTGSFVNRAGRAQGFAPDRAPGLSVIQLIDHERFPRQPRVEPPKSEARPAWWALETLRERTIGTPEARDLAGVRGALWRSHAFWGPLRDVVPGDPGLPLDPSRLEIAMPTIAAFPKPSGLSLFRVERALGSEVLSRWSAPMRKMAGPATAWIAPGDASGLEDGAAVVEIEAGGETSTLLARTIDTIPRGVVLVSRDAAWTAAPSPGAAAKIRARETAEVTK
jgi:NADH-quinone oxidoreductase subunit G